MAEPTYVPAQRCATALCGRVATHEADIYDGEHDEPVLALYCDSCADVLRRGNEDVRELKLYMVVPDAYATIFATPGVTVRERLHALYGPNPQTWPAWNCHICSEHQLNAGWADECGRCGTARLVPLVTGNER